jgi:hypothetical protein
MRALEAFLEVLFGLVPSFGANTLKFYKIYAFLARFFVELLSTQCYNCNNFWI